MLEEIEAIEENTQSVLRSIISEYADKKGDVELKYIEINEALEQQKKTQRNRVKVQIRLKKKYSLKKSRNVKQ